MSIERFWLRATDSDSWREVTLQEFVRAERMAGFRNTMGTPGPACDRSLGRCWWTIGHHRRTGGRVHCAAGNRFA